MAGRPLPPLDTRAGQFVLKGQPIAAGSAVVASRVQITGPWGGPAVEGLVWDAVTGGEIVRLLDRIPDWALAALSPDGRWLAHVTGGRGRGRGPGHAAPGDGPGSRTPPAAAGRPDTKALAFSPDADPAGHGPRGRDGPRLGRADRRPATRGRAADVDTLWAALGSPAADAWRAQWHLLDLPGPATDLLKARARSRSRRWTDTADQIAKLDHPRYAVREEAARELARRGAVVEGNLRAALRKTDVGRAARAAGRAAQQA